MRKNRSDSSLLLRNHLKQNFVIVPDITEKVSLSSYILLARNLYNAASNAQQNGDFRRAYIDLYKFQRLTLERIPTHRDFRSNSTKLLDDRIWLSKIKIPAMENLERVVGELDREEDIRLANLQELEMIDEFEHLDHGVNDDDDEIHNHEVVKGFDESICGDNKTEKFPIHDVFNIKVNTNDNCLHRPESSLGSIVSNNLCIANSSNQNHSKDISRLSILKLSSPIDYSVPIEKPSTHNIAIESSNIKATKNTMIPVNKSMEVISIQDVIYDTSCLGIIEASMLQYIGEYSRFKRPQPSISTINVMVGLQCYSFHQEDYHTSYASFLLDQPIDLQLSRPAVEMNRCFFIHMGIAANIHPFVLQCVFRIRSFNIIKNLDKDDFSKDILASVLEYCGFVDANALCFLWPKEFNGYRICFISGSLESPILSCFQHTDPATDISLSSSGKLKDLVIRCNGDHFTILRPINFGFNQFLNNAKEAKLVVQINNTSLENNHSIKSILSVFSKNNNIKDC